MVCPMEDHSGQISDLFLSFVKLDSFKCWWILVTYPLDKEETRLCVFYSYIFKQKELYCGCNKITPHPVHDELYYPVYILQSRVCNLLLINMLQLFVSNIIRFIVIWLSLSMGGSIFIDKRQIFNKVNPV